MSQANPLVLFLAGCSHHTRLNHSVHVADLAGSWIHGQCKNDRNPQAEER